LGGNHLAQETRPVVVADISTAVAFDAGGAHSCAQLASGKVHCWGWNNSGQLGDATIETRIRPVTVIGLSDVRQISAGENHSCALLEDGAVQCWGGNLQGQIALPLTDNALQFPVKLPRQ
jgi:alpha-tubulin suppressor-like RCC1 family protein